jgi:hypothetical protein
MACKDGDIKLLKATVASTAFYSLLGRIVENCLVIAKNCGDE